MDYVWFAGIAIGVAGIPMALSILLTSGSGPRDLHRARPEPWHGRPAVEPPTPETDTPGMIVLPRAPAPQPYPFRHPLGEPQPRVVLPDQRRHPPQTPALPAWLGKDVEPGGRHREDDD